MDKFKEYVLKVNLSLVFICANVISTLTKTFLLPYFVLLTELLDILHKFRDPFIGLKHESLHPLGRTDGVELIRGFGGVQLDVESKIALGCPPH